MKLYHWFIPNKKNRFHPVALRSTGLIIFLIIFIGLQFAYNLTAANKFQVLGYATNVSINDLLNISNQDRIDNGLAALNLNPKLNSAALAKANDMFTDNYWAHVAPDGATPWSFIYASGYDYSSAGENLAKDFNTSSGVVSGWMNSPTHRANVLSSSYKEVGYAVVNGTLLGSETTLVVAMYGLENEPVIAQAAPAPAPTPTPTNNNSTSATNTVATSTPVTSAPITGNTTTISQETISENTTADNDQTSTNDNENSTNDVDKPIASTSKPNDIGSVAGAAIAVPIEKYNSLNWGQKASIVLIFTLILLFIMKHTLIWREHKRGLRHIWLRSHPIGQAAILMTVLIITLASGVGVIL